MTEKQDNYFVKTQKKMKMQGPHLKSVQHGQIVLSLIHDYSLQTYHIRRIYIYIYT